MSRALLCRLLHGAACSGLGRTEFSLRDGYDLPPAADTNALTQDLFASSCLAIAGGLRDRSDHIAAPASAVLVLGLVVRTLGYRQLPQPHRPRRVLRQNTPVSFGVNKRDQPAGAIPLVVDELRAIGGEVHTPQAVRASEQSVPLTVVVLAVGHAGQAVLVPPPQASLVGPNNTHCVLRFPELPPG